MDLRQRETAGGGPGERERHLMDFNDSLLKEEGSRKREMNDGRERKEIAKRRHRERRGM